MGATPDELKSNIERTRSELTADVDALADRVSPGKIARRRTEAVRGTMSGAKDRVMGGVSSATSAPTAVADRAQGNPLAVGLVAFGAGLLASSLLPSTSTEQQIATAVKDTAVEPIKAFAKDQAQQAQETLQPAAQEAAADLKESAVSAAQNTTEHAKSATNEVADRTRDAAQTVKD
jgi:Protein of unknown function (DUF3618)